MARPKSRLQKRQEESKNSENKRLLFKGFDCTTPESSRVFVNHIFKLLSEGKEPKKELDINDEVIEYIYSLAYAFYREGKYDKACPLFYLVLLLDGKNPKYSYSLGAVFQMKENYAGALYCYGLSFVNDPSDPTPLLRQAECAFKCNLIDDGKHWLKLAVETAGDKEEYKYVKQRAQAMLDTGKL